MTLLSRVLVLVGLVVLAGCASVQERVPTNAVPTPGLGYVGGHFTSVSRLVTGFLLVNTKTQKAVVLSFSGNSLRNDRGGAAGLIAVPPGTYRISDHIAFNKMVGPLGAAGNQWPIPLWEISQEFVVQANKVVFLGKFNGHTDIALGEKFGKAVTRGTTLISYVKGTTGEAKQIIDTAYPAFSSLPLTCIMCVE